MNIFQITAIVLLLLGLSACSAMQEIKADRDARRAAADRSECIAMGFNVGTDTFLLCLDNRNIVRKAEQTASWAEWRAKRRAKKAERAAERARINAIFDD